MQCKCFTDKDELSMGIMSQDYNYLIELKSPVWWSDDYKEFRVEPFQFGFFRGKSGLFVYSGLVNFVLSMDWDRSLESPMIIDLGLMRFVFG